VVWQSTREDARVEVYRSRADGSDATRLTRTGAGVPLWSPDGRWISYRDEVGGVYLMRPDGTGQHNVSTTAVPGFWRHDNSGLVIIEGHDYSLLDPETKQRTPLFKVTDFPQFAGTTFQPNAMTHDNRYLLLGSHLYHDGYTGANGAFTSGYSALMVDLFDKSKIYFIGNGCWPFSPPTGDLVFHVCNDCPQHPDIYRMSVKDVATRSSYQPEQNYPDKDWGHEYNPRVSTDGKWMVYMTSTGCHDGLGCDYEIFLHRLGAPPTERTRVTGSFAFDGYPDMYVGPLWQEPAAPRLFARPNRLTFFASAGATPASQAVNVKGEGGAAFTAAKAALEPAVPWLSVSVEGTAVTVQVKPEALTRGQHAATVAVSADGIDAPITIPVLVQADDSFPAPPDAGTPGAPDAGAGLVTDAAVAGADAGDAGGGSGCSCEAGGRAGGAAWSWLLLVAGAAALIRRGRRLRA
jgi:MYXO-CTERM domain-containing protein